MAIKVTCSFGNFTTSTSEEERLRNRYLIRARTVKNNRRNQLLRTSREQENYSTRKATGSARTILPAQNQSLDSQPNVEISNPAKTRSRPDDGESQDSRAPVAQSADTNSALGLPAPILPIFGALATDTFDSSCYSTVSEISVLVFDRLLSRVFNQVEISSYWQSFCQNPLIFYSYSHLHLFVHDNVHGAISGRDKARKYSLNIKISSMLQETLPTLRDEDVEPALSAQSTLFTPYTLYADLLEAFQAGHIESLVPAVGTLVARIGGLDRLKTPGLSKMIRMNGLIQASANCDAPYSDNCWNTHRLLAAQGPVWDFLSETETPGIGFRTLVPGGLQASALAAYLNLSTTDRLLAQHRPDEISVKEFQLLTSSRASVQHQLLSLDSWSDLPISEQGLSSLFLYECIRNTAILYCNAVIRPVLPGSRGIQEPLRRPRQLLEAIDTSAIWGAGSGAVILWCLVMASLGSVSTQHWWFFIALLREHLDRCQISSTEELVKIVRPFVWSDSACRQGREVIWSAMHG